MYTRYCHITNNTIVVGWQFQEQDTWLEGAAALGTGFTKTTITSLTAGHAGRIITYQRKLMEPLLISD